MSRPLNKLSAAAVKTLPVGKHADGGGLWLNKRNDGGAQWVLRITVHGRRREMGLGSAHEVSLREARVSADRWRGVARDNKDPIKEREHLRREAARNLHTLEEIAIDAFESRKADLKGDGEAGRWFSPVGLHIIPKLGKVPIGEIDQTDIRNTLAPIWHKKAVTARKALNRLSIILKHGAALGYEVDLQAADKAKALLGGQRHDTEHIPAMRWQDVPAFYATLSEPTPTHLALRLIILTGMRSSPVRFIRPVEQIVGDIWTVPAVIMKGRKGATTDFRVALSSEAMNVIHLAMPYSRAGYLFSNGRGTVISDMTMSRHMEREGLKARPHGFRSSLRDWIDDTTSTPYQVAETVLGHIVGGATERAYRRTDYIEQRRPLMEQWAKYVLGETEKAAELQAGA